MILPTGSPQPVPWNIAPTHRWDPNPFSLCNTSANKTRRFSVFDFKQTCDNIQTINSSHFANVLRFIHYIVRQKHDTSKHAVSTLIADTAPTHRWDSNPFSLCNTSVSKKDDFQLLTFIKFTCDNIQAINSSHFCQCFPIHPLCSSAEAQHLQTCSATTVMLY